MSGACRAAHAALHPHPAPTSPPRPAPPPCRRSGWWTCCLGTRWWGCVTPAARTRPATTRCATWASAPRVSGRGRRSRALAAAGPAGARPGGPGSSFCWPLPRPCLRLVYTSWAGVGGLPAALRLLFRSQIVLKDGSFLLLRPPPRALQCRTTCCTSVRCTRPTPWAASAPVASG